MYATVHQFRRSVPTEHPGWDAALAHDLHGTTPAGSCTLVQLAGIEGSVVAYWPDEEAAAAAVARPAPAGGPTWLDAAIYRVVEVHAGAAAGQSPAFAHLTCFDGPRSPAEADASERAGRERLWPAVQHLPGIVAVHVLRDADNGAVVIGLATTLETHEAVQQAVFATELLPWEDPALLRGPDRVQLARVVAAELPVPAGASS